MLVSFHTTYTASAMFLTGMAANPLIAEFALQDRPRRAHLDALVLRLDRARAAARWSWCRGCSSAGSSPRSATPARRASWRADELARMGPLKPGREVAGRHHARRHGRMGDVAVARNPQYVRGARGALRDSARAGADLGRSAGRASRLGRADLVCAAGDDGRPAERARRHQDSFRQSSSA